MPVPQYPAFHMMPSPLTMLVSGLLLLLLPPGCPLSAQPLAAQPVVSQPEADGWDSRLAGILTQDRIADYRHMPEFGADAGEGRKSGFLAAGYSLLFPGMGELYAGRFDRGKYPLAAEIALWIGALGINAYGNWVQNDARIFAQRHAGVDPSGKDDDFFVDIENYSDLHDFNNQRLIERRTDELYPDEATWRWTWDTEQNREEYKDLRIHADEMHNAVTFFVLGMVANRIWSAIQAATVTRQYNASLGERLTALPAMQTRVNMWAGRVDGVEIRFSW